MKTKKRGRGNTGAPKARCGGRFAYSDSSSCCKAASTAHACRTATLPSLPAGTKRCHCVPQKKWTQLIQTGSVRFSLWKCCEAVFTDGRQNGRGSAAPQLRCPAATWRTTETWPERLRGINSQLKVFCFSPSTYWATVHPMAGRLRRPRIGCTCIRRIRRTQRCACKLWVDAVRGQCRTAPQFRNRLDPFS